MVGVNCAVCRASPLKASGWTNWPGEEVGRLKASWVDVMVLRLEFRLFLLVKRFANQLMVRGGGQDSKPERCGGEGGR